MRRSRIVIATLALLARVDSSAVAQADEADARREDRLKAAYLFNFVKFIEWPGAAPGQTLAICFLGASGVYGALSAGIESQKVGSRPLAARRLERASGVEGCSVLYVDAEIVSSKWHSVLEAKLPVLTVSNARNFTHNGGVIELFTESNRLRFNINVDNAQKAGLRISSSLLQLAAAVEKEITP